jgi:GTP cyclohydrolase I
MREIEVAEPVAYALPEFIASHDSGKLEQVKARRAMETPSPLMMDAVREVLAVDLDSIINGAMFEEDFDEPVVVKDITFHSMCEHHMLPFYGKVSVAYIPNGKVVGLSKIPRIVETFARRLQVQERMTAQIADFIEHRLRPQGVAVIAEGVHMCAVMRGVQQPSSLMRTQSLRGRFREDRQLLEQVLG